MASTIDFKRPDGQAVKGFLAEAEAPLGAVVVIQEWWGLNDQIRGVAQRLADAGFTGRKEPYDAFWGQRYATVADPDGNAVDIFAPL